MKQKKSIKEIKEMLGLNNIHPEVNGREKLQKMIDPMKYYLVQGHVLPFKGSTILERDFQPSLIKQDLGYTITAEQWREFNNKLKEQQEWFQHRQQYQEE